MNPNAGHRLRVGLNKKRLIDWILRERRWTEARLSAGEGRGAEGRLVAGKAASWTNLAWKLVDGSIDMSRETGRHAVIL